MWRPGLGEAQTHTGLASPELKVRYLSMIVDRL